MPALGSDLSSLKRRNRTAVLNAILRKSTCTRRDLAEATGLTASSISSIIGQLIDEEFVVEQVAAEEPVHSGRPATLLALNPAGGYVLGVQFGLMYITLAIGDLNGRLAGFARFPVPSPTEPKRAFETIFAEADQLIVHAAIPRDRLLGMGVGLVGIVDAAQGIVRSMPRGGWDNVPVRTWCEQWSGLPVAVDNTRRGMALAERLFGVAQGEDNLLLVHCYATVGCGMVIDGQIYRGARDASGQLAHVTVVPGGALCTCGERGCLDTVASEEGIARLAREAVLTAREGWLLDQVGGRLEEIDAQLVLEGTRKGDPMAVRVIEQVGGYLGIAVGNLVAVLDPGLVVIAGLVVDAGDLFLGPLTEQISRRARRVLGRSVKVRASTHGLQGAALGAVGLALSEFVYGSDARHPV